MGSLGLSRNLINLIGAISLVNHNIDAEAQSKLMSKTVSLVTQTERIGMAAILCINMNVTINTRMHSSRMHTADFGGHH